MSNKKPKWNPATHKTRTVETVYECPVEKLYPLFCPVREFEYMRNWTCTMRFSESGYAEKNAIFQSGYPFPPGMKATWVCTNYEKNKSLTYTIFIPNTVIIVLEHKFEKLNDNKTTHIVAISGFGLNWLGRIMLKKMFSKADDKDGWRDEMTKELVYFLKYGKKIG